MLILHIGLPKTGSTFLQKEVFPKMGQITLLHKHMPPLGRLPMVGEKFMNLLRKLIHSRKARTRVIGQWIFILISFFGRVLISNENFSMKPIGIWTNKGIGPDDFTKWLGEVKQKSNKPIKVIFGIRRWDEWFASRYAQSAIHFDNPGQKDFEERTRKILASELSPGSVYGWLDYASVISSLKEVLGEHNVMIYRTEDLESHRFEVVRKAFTFLGVELPEVYRDELAWLDVKKRNVRRTSSNSWKLRRSKDEISLTPDFRREVAAKFGDYERTSTF